MAPPPNLLVSTRTLSSPYVDGCRVIRIERRPLLVKALSAVRGRPPPSLDAVLADMTQERDKAPALFLPLARDGASEDASLDLLLPLPVGGVGLTAVAARPVTDAPPGRAAGKLSARCRGGVFLNRDSLRLPLPEPLPSTPRLLVLWVPLAGERVSPLVLPLAPALARLPRVLLELESVLLLLLLLPLLPLRASDEADVPIRKGWRLAGPNGDSSTLISSLNVFMVRLLYCCDSSTSSFSSNIKGACGATSGIS